MVLKGTPIIHPTTYHGPSDSPQRMHDAMTCQQSQTSQSPEPPDTLSTGRACHQCLHPKGTAQRIQASSAQEGANPAGGGPPRSQGRPEVMQSGRRLRRWRLGDFWPQKRGASPYWSCHMCHDLDSYEAAGLRLAQAPETASYDVNSRRPQFRILLVVSMNRHTCWA